MNRKWVMAFVILGSILVYLVIINIISSIVSVNLTSIGNEGATSQEGADVKIGISDSIGITVQRNRLYGTILETSGSLGATSKLYVLGFIPLPLRSNGTNLIFWHITLIIGLGTFAYYIINRFKRHHYERGPY